MRGKVTEILDYLDGLRITPAYAGKSRAGQATQVRVRDHPRVCGEKQGVPAVAGRNLGSPPRMRGKVLPLLHSPHPPGITPACAGKRLRIGVRYAQRKDHPRVCGEKRQGNMNKEVKVGSPPRMRGKGLMDAELSNAVGITPAYAGKSFGSFCFLSFRQDHPRVCGEKCSSVRSASHRRGSPPRVRGKVCDLTIIRVHHGITPAYAGKRLKRSHSIGHFSCILCLFHSVLHRASVSGGSRAGPRAPPCLPAQNTVPV